MDSVNAFNVFVQVAETRSFVAAGRLLGVSASAVGKSVVRLEASLGVRLFHRSTRSMTLTAEGDLFLVRSRRILAEIDAAQRELSHTRDAPHGRLKVSLPLTSEPFLSAIAGFKQAYPDVDLDLDFTDRTVDVIEEGFDAVIRGGSSADSRLGIRRLGVYRMVLVGAPDYFARYGTPDTPADLTHHKCIQYRFPNTGKLQEWLLDGMNPQELNLAPTLISNNLDARICFAVHGLGIAYLPDFAIDELIQTGRLVTVLDDYATTEGAFHILWPSARAIAPKLRAFIDFLCDRLFVRPKNSDRAG